MLSFTKIKQLALLFGDFAILFASLYITLFIRYSQTLIPSYWHEHFYPFAIIYFIWVAVFFSQNLYNLTVTKNNFYFLKTFIESFAINILIASIFFYFTPFLGIAPKTNLFLNAAVAILLLSCWRTIFNIFAARYSHKNRIVFFGYGKEAEELLIAFHREPQLGYQPILVVTDAEFQPPVPGAKRMSVSEFMQTLKNFKINTIAIHYSRNLDKEAAQKLYELIFDDVVFVNLLDLYEDITAKLPIETLSQGWFLENLAQSEKKIYDRAKIIIDYVLAFILGLVLAALFIPVSLIILATSGRPILFVQDRVGKKGKIFKIYKFRTMVRNAENGVARFASKDDPRATAFGRFLRRTRIDELPQIINVLKSNMSFIGPRPERPEFISELSLKAPFYPLRHLVKPGLTGWAQINFNYAGSIEENLKKLQYDIYYIKNRSFLLDVATILKTFNTIIRFKGR